MISRTLAGVQRRLRRLTLPIIPEIDIAEAARRLQAVNPPRLVDVRQPAEFRDGHIPGALNHPLTSRELPSVLFEGGRDVLVVCASGHRSLLGAARLCWAGLTPVSIRGGTTAWTRAGLPLTRGE